MKKYIFLIPVLLLIFSCKEEGVDPLFTKSQKETEVKQELIMGLVKTIKLAINDPTKGAEAYSKLNETIKYEGIDIANDPDMLAYNKYALDAIDFGQFKVKLMANLDETDFSNYELIGKTGTSYSDKFVAPPSDLALLLQYRLTAETKKNSYRASWSIESKKDEEIEAFLTNEFDAVLSILDKKLQSYTSLTGMEDQLAGSNWKLSKYDVFEGYYQPGQDLFTENGLWPFELQFKNGNLLECDSVMIPHVSGPSYTPVPTIDKIKTYTHPPLKANIRAGKEMKKEGEYYFGDKYISLVFNILDGHKIVVTMAYDKDVFEASEHKDLTPLRDPKMDCWSCVQGKSKVYVALIDAQMHYGVFQEDDHSQWTFRQKVFVTPFRWNRQD